MNDFQDENEFDCSLGGIIDEEFKGNMISEGSEFFEGGGGILAKKITIEGLLEIHRMPVAEVERLAKSTLEEQGD